MKKTIYRTALFNGHNEPCEKLVLLAAKSNGGAAISLNDLKTVVDANRIQWPTLYGDLTAEIIGERILHVDRKMGEQYETVCRIEQVEILELEEPVDDIPEDVFTATNGHGALAE